MTAGKSLLLSKRFSLALICFAGCALCYALRSNLSFAIVCMVKETESDGATGGRTKHGCGHGPQRAVAEQQQQQHQLNKTGMISRFRRQSNGSIFDAPQHAAHAQSIPAPLSPGEFDWSKQVRGQVLGAFFFGYLASQMLGGLLAARIGAKSVILCSMLAASLLSLLSPGAARFHVSLFILLRALLGFSQGVMFPAMHCLWSNWAPPLERGLLTGVSYAGAQIGNVLVMPLSGILCRHGFDGGWPSIFYMLSAAGLCWSLLWALTVANSPQRHSSIGADERQFIMESLGQRKDSDDESIRASRPIPIGAILRSKAVWAILIGHFAGDWGAYMMALGLPSFLNDVLGLQMTSMGFASAIPYVAYFAVINLGGHLADSLLQRQLLTTLNCRRLAMALALSGQAFFLLLISFCPCGYDKLVIALLTLSIGISGFQYSGFVINYLDIAPELAGFLLGLGNTVSCLAGFVGPMLMGWLTPTGSKTEWLTVFGITELILVFGAVAFSVLASADVQPWAAAKRQQSNDEDDEEEGGRTRSPEEQCMKKHPDELIRKHPMAEELLLLDNDH
uniref:Major facilitator superfamily (MFS) profile domain-containing protein n=1 Tax=Globodera rostochiensis TaxID=31243 RepID=A0A914HKG5_GLORO